MAINWNTRPYIVINGTDSRSLQGLIICKLPPISLPAKMTNVETIDGRDGDIVTDLGFAAYDKDIEIGLANEYNVDDVIAFFNATGKIVFGNEPDKYYIFGNYEQIDLERLLRMKQATVTLHVQPFKYSDDEDEEAYQFDGTNAKIKARNAGNIFSRPTITIKGAGDIELYINGEKKLDIALPYDGKTIIIDSANMEALGIDGNFLNRLVTGNYDNITLKQGINEIEAVGNVNEIKISLVSRWI